MLIIGCGDVGQKIASRAQHTGETVHCVVKSAESALLLSERGIDAKAVDLDHGPVPLTGALDQQQIYYLAPPPASGSHDSRMQRFLSALSVHEYHRIVYISTTGVYGNCNGEWVDEHRAADPQVDRARRRHDAEEQLRAWRQAGPGEIVILRVAGIYGPGKLPIRRIEQRIPMVGVDDAPWTNRIQIDDLVRVCEAAMTRGADGEVYNVSDGNPGNMRDYFDRVADRFGLPRPPPVSLAQARTTLSQGMLSYLAESRRLDNRKMIRELGVNLRYPDLESGLQACGGGSR